MAVEPMSGNYSGVGFPSVDHTWHNITYGSNLDRLPGWRRFMVAGLSIESFCGTVGNLLVIFAILYTPALRATANYFIVNLSVADLMVTAIAQPSNIVGALLGAGPYVRHHRLCSAIATLCATGCIASTWNICMIAVNRYIIICHFTIYDKIYTKRNTILMCIGVWVLIYLIQLPNHLGWGDTRYSQRMYLCTFATHEYFYTMFYFGIGVYVPVIISFIAYLKIFLRVRNSKFVRSRAVGPAAKPGSRREVQSMLENIKIARVLFKLFIVFLLMWTPGVLLYVIESEASPRIHPAYYIIVSLLAHGNSTLNVILYAAALPQFREAFRARTKKLERSSVKVGSWTGNGSIKSTEITDKTAPSSKIQHISINSKSAPVAPTA